MKKNWFILGFGGSRTKRERDVPLNKSVSTTPGCLKRGTKPSHEYIYIYMVREREKKTTNDSQTMDVGSL
jgi:hypothetical protein